MNKFFSVIVVFFLLSIPAWFTHVFTCFANEQWGFLIAGAIMFPIAIFHGWWIWIMGIVHLIF